MDHNYRIIIAFCFSINFVFGQEIETTSSYDVNLAAPLDGRVKIATLADTSMIDYTYAGLITSVVDIEKVYVYYNGWKPLATSEGFASQNDSIVKLDDNTFLLFLNNNPIPDTIEFPEYESLLDSLVQDATPQLGGNLDPNGNYINGDLGVNKAPSVALDVLGNGVFSGTVTGADPTTDDHLINRGWANGTYLTSESSEVTKIYNNVDYNLQDGEPPTWMGNMNYGDIYLDFINDRWFTWASGLIEDYWEQIDDGISTKSQDDGSGNLMYSFESVATPKERLDIGGAILIGANSNENAGTIRYDSLSAQFEGYNGSEWVRLDGLVYNGCSDDTYNSTRLKYALAGLTNSYDTAYVDSVIYSSGVVDPSNVLGAVDGSYASWELLGDTMIIELEDYVVTGEELYITGRKDFATASDPDMIFEESCDGINWTTNSISPLVLSRTSFAEDTMVAESNFKYLRITTTDIYDYELDAIRYRVPNETATTLAQNDSIVQLNDNTLLLYLNNNPIPDTLVFSGGGGSSQWTDVTGGIEYDEDVNIGGALNISGSSTSGRTSIIENTDNSSSTAHSVLSLKNGGSSGGDTRLQLTAFGEGTWYQGLDNDNGNGLSFAWNNPDLTTSSRLFLGTSGNIGIGTSAPSFGLHLLEKDLKIEATADNNRYLEFENDTDYAAQMMVGRSGAGDRANHFGLVAVDAGMDFLIESFDNVGIATSTPSFKLDVNGTAASTATLDYGAAFTVRDNGNAINWSRLDWANTNQTDNGMIYLESGGEFVIRNEVDSMDIKFMTKDGSAATRMTITHDGNIGIGTINPTEALDVVGTIEADDLTINGVSVTEKELQIPLFGYSQIVREGGVVSIAIGNEFDGYSCTHATVKTQTLGTSYVIDIYDNTYVDAGSDASITVDATSENNYNITDVVLSEDDFITIGISSVVGTSTNATLTLKCTK